MKSAKAIADTVFCILGHIEDMSPPKVKEIGEFLSVVPPEAGVPILELQSSIEILYAKFAESNEISFKNALIDGNYVRSVLFLTNGELRLQFDEANANIPYHARLLNDLHTELGSIYYKTRIQQAINVDDFGKVEYYNTLLKSLSAQETHIYSGATQVAKQYIVNQSLYGSGIVTGIPQIDNAIDHLTYKSLNVIMAPSANFKTTTACSIAYNAVMSQGKNVVYFTLEDFDEIIWYNMIARHSFENGGKKIPASAMKKYKISSIEELNLMNEIAQDFDKKMTNGSFTVLSKHSCKDLSPAGIELKLREISNKIGADIDMVVIDHFNLLNMPIKSMPWLTGSELQRYYVTALTNLSITLGKRGFILLGLAQLNREGQGTFEGGEMASSLHVAGTIELLWSATNFIYMFADSTARSAGLLKGKIIKSRFSTQGLEFVTNIQPAYCIVGKGADSTNPKKDITTSTYEVVDANKASRMKKQEQLEKDVAEQMNTQQMQIGGLDDLATMLTGIGVVNNSEIITKGKGTSKGPEISET